MTDEKTRALIAEARKFLRSENAQYYDSSLIGALADALSALTVPDGDARERLLRLITEYMPGREGIPKVQDVWLADAILATFPVPRMIAALEAVTRIHREVEGVHGDRVCAHRYCVDGSLDQVAWPCPTIRAIEAALGGEGDA